MSGSSRLGRDRFGLLAFLLYLVVSILYFARAVAADPGAYFIGGAIDHDPSLYMWCLRWWPWALAHRIDPFFCPMVWAPVGVNLAWVTSLPAAALLAAPLTAAAGPVVSFNVLCILAIALAGWAAFMLCRSLTDGWWPALLGGYLFAFSPYMLGHLLGQLFLLLVFPVPLIAWLIVLHFQGRILRPVLVVAVAALIVLEFGFSIEVAATMTLFGAGALALGYAVGSGEWQMRIRGVLAPLALSYAAAAMLLAPYLYHLFAFGFPHGSIVSPKGFSSDLLNFLLPTPSNLLGANAALAHLASRYPHLSEADAYLAIPLAAIAAAWWWKRRATGSGKFLGILLLALIVASLGPRLHVAGHTLFGLPWKLFSRAPLIRSALPDRFAMYIALVLAVIGALWADTAELGGAAMAGVVGAIILFTLPNPAAGFWTVKVDTPEFFTSGAYRNYLVPGENVLVIPYGQRGNSMLWQAETAMYFRMAGGHTGPTVDRSFEQWPVVNALYFRTALPDAAVQMGAFAVSHDVGAIIVDAREPQWWKPMVESLGAAPQQVGGVYLYKLDGSKFAAYREMTAPELERRYDEIRFDNLLVAADQYLARGGELAALTPRSAEQAGLLPSGSAVDSEVYSRNGLWLGASGKGLVAVGIVASYEPALPLIEKYRGDARAVYYPWPRRLSGAPRGDTFMRKLVMVFDRDGLKRAAIRAKAGSATSGAATAH
jgi:hypothetical protein